MEEQIEAHLRRVRVPGLCSMSRHALVAAAPSKDSCTSSSDVLECTGDEKQAGSDPPAACLRHAWPDSVAADSALECIAVASPAAPGADAGLGAGHGWVAAAAQLAEVPQWRVPRTVGEELRRGPASGAAGLPQAGRRVDVRQVSCGAKAARSADRSCTSPTTTLIFT